MHLNDATDYIHFFGKVENTCELHFFNNKIRQLGVRQNLI